MKLAFVVPRYGPDLLGGPEHQARLIAERLAAHHQVDVLTTCAADARSWANVYPEGADRLRGVTVRRFATVRPPERLPLNRLADRVLHGRHGRQEELDWLRQRGPSAPALLEHLERQHAQYHALVFVTALQPAAVLGIGLAPSKSILVPALHDGPELGLGVLRECLAIVGGFAWQTDQERRLVSSRVHLRRLVEDVVGCGVDLPEGEAPEDSTDWRLVGPPDRELLPPHLEGAANAFRRRHRLYGPFVLQAGRIEPGQGCEELLEYFHEYVEARGEAKLVLMGSKLMPLPEDPGVRFGGILPDEERPHSLEAATVVAVPAPDDSQLMLALEALSVGTPVLVNARAEVLVHHCRESQAGLYYADRWEFSEALKLLVRDAALRSALGRNGRAYVSRHFRWPTVIAQYERLFEALRPGSPVEAVETSEHAARGAKPGEVRGDRSRLRDRARRPRGDDRGRRDRPRQRSRHGR
jgi:glycosyltransferase involved in cell wall biosynthesis